MADDQDAIELKRRARRRLVGAIALVVFVVIVLPIVLDREPKPMSQDLTIQIPSQDAGKFSSRILPVQPGPGPVPPVGATAEVPPQSIATPLKPKPVAEAKIGVKKPVEEAAAKSAKQAVKATESASKAQPPAPKPAATAKAEPAAKVKPAANAEPIAKAVPAPVTEAAKPSSAPVAESKASAGEQRFFVPLGLFSKADNVKQVRAKASAAGIKTMTEPVAGSSRVRVRAGPFANRDAAEKAREKLKSAGLEVGTVAVR